MGVCDDFSVGNVGLDYAQTVKKAWCHCNLGHRTVPIHADYNIVEHTYTSSGQLCTVEYFFESKAESTRVTFVADCSSSLNGKSFSVFSKDDAVRYSILYSVACATTAPVDTATIKNILVNIQACDPASVISLATKQAISNNISAASDVSLSIAQDKLTIINKSKGEATDAVNGGTGFTFEILQQGIKTSIEKLNYTYNSDGKVNKVTSTSGENVLNITGPFEQTVSIGSKGNIDDVNDNKELRTELSPLQNELLENIVTELRIMNFHLTLVTDTEITKKDLDPQ